MAFTVNFTDPATGHPRFNFDQTLTTGSRGADVQLLQVLLNMLYFDLSPASSRFNFVASTDRLSEDGILGKQTASLTNDFIVQARTSANLFNIRDNPEAAGIDPMRKPGELSPRLKVRFVIDALNTFCSSFSSQLGIDRYRRLASDPKTPTQLRNALKTVKSTANKYKLGG